MQIDKHKFICRLNINVSCLQTFFSHFLLLQNPQKYRTSTAYDKNTTCIIRCLSVDIGNTARLFVAAGDVGGREGAGGGTEQGPARAAWSRTTQDGVRSLAGVQGSWSVGRVVCSLCPGLRQQAAALTLRLCQSGQRYSTQPTKATSASHSITQQSHSDMECVCVWVTIYVGWIKFGKVVGHIFRA